MKNITADVELIAGNAFRPDNNNVETHLLMNMGIPINATTNFGE